MGDNNLVVDLRNVDNRRFIVNDKIFNRKISDNTFFWVSGGGSIVINNKYILLVKRSHLCNVNPGKFSIFTGRANNIDELNNPELLIRELFEELIISKKNILYYPKCSQFQRVIDTVYFKFKENFYNRRRIQFLDLNLNYLSCKNKKIIILNKLGKKEFYLDYYINNANDINVLFLLSAELEIKDLFAFDGEYYSTESGAINYFREIYLYNFNTSMGKIISDNLSNEYVRIKDSNLTGHCNYIIKSLRKELK